MRVESLDRSAAVRFDSNPVTLRSGFTGLEQAPVSLAISNSPGVEGGAIEQAQTVSRPIMLPLAVYGRDQASAWAAVQRLVEVVRPGEAVTREGSFRLVASSTSGVRELTCAYLSGLEGIETGNPRFDQIALSLIAVDPYARDRDPRSVEFTLGEQTSRMVSANPGTAGSRKLGSSVVIGEDMPVEIVSGIPVWPRLDFTGPFSPLTVTASTGMSISVPGGVPAGQTLTVVTDPRNKSIRLQGNLAAGLVARGSRIGAPFQPGINNLSVAATGATAASRIVLSWRGGWRSLW